MGVASEADPGLGRRRRRLIVRNHVVALDQVPISVHEDPIRHGAVAGVLDGVADDGAALGLDREPGALARGPIGLGG